MPLMRKAEPMTMEWCLDCHREPQRFIRPVESVFDMNYTRPSNQLALGEQLIAEYNIPVEQLTDCYICHR